MACEISLTLSTWNINKSYPRGVSQRGSAKRRDILTRGVFNHLDKQQQKPDVVMIQESPMPERKAKTKLRLSANYRQQMERRGLHQGIDTTLDEKDMDSLSGQMDLLVPKGETDHQDALEQADRQAGFADDIIVSDSNDRRLMRSDIPSRAFARKLEVTQNGTYATIIVVSFHSIYKKNVETRRRYIYLFFNLMCRLAHVHRCPVLIGGDFNLPVGDWRRDIEQRFGGRVYVAEIYSPACTHRRSKKNIIDTFASVCPPGGRVTITWNKPVAVYPFPEHVPKDSTVVNFSESDKKEIKRLLPDTDQQNAKKSILWYDLDHDPVTVTVKLNFDCVPLLFDSRDQRDTSLVPCEYMYYDPRLLYLINMIQKLPNWGYSSIIVSQEIPDSYSLFPVIQVIEHFQTLITMINHYKYLDFGTSITVLPHGCWCTVTYGISPFTYIKYLKQCSMHQFESSSNESSYNESSSDDESSCDNSSLSSHESADYV